MGNARAGRTFKDVEELAAGRSVEVPPNDEALGLILADDQEYEACISKIVSDRQDANEDSLVSHAVASLLRARSSDRTLSDHHRHASFMARTIGSAIALIRKHGTFKAAIAAGNGNEAARAIEYFVRMRPDQGIIAAVRTFEAALQDYRHDSAVLEPLLPQYGSRPLGSFAAPAAERRAPLQQDQDVGALVQKLREARYAARHLHGHLGALRAALPKSLFERIVNAPIEDAPEILGSASGTDPRSMAANLVTRRSIHGILQPSEIGSECRIVGAEIRRDGRLAADWPTVVMPADRIPRIDLGPNAVSTTG